MLFYSAKRLAASISAGLLLLIACSNEDSNDGGFPVWKTTSTRFELSSFGFWIGGTGYEKARVDMSSEQLNALAGLRTIPTPTGPVGADFTSFRIQVVDEDGSSVTYRAAQDNIVDSDEGESALTLPTIDYETLESLLATIHCLSARESTPQTRTTDTPVNPSTEDIATAVSLPTDVGCKNGVFVPYNCSDIVFILDVSTPTKYRFSGESCIENLSLRVYASDGTTLLSQSTQPAAPDTCFSLEYAFDAGKYVLVLSKTNIAGCSAQGSTGDTFLRLQHVW